MRRRPDPRAGFTLIEVLAALAITAALVAVVLPFAGGLIERWRAGQASVDAADGWMQAVARLSDDFAEAVPIRTGAAGQRLLTFHADPRVVEFVRPALGGSHAAGLEVVTYTVVSAAAGDSLVRRARAFGPDGPVGGPVGNGAPVTILDGGYALRFSIVGPNGVPQSRWVDPKVMPVRVDLVVTRPNGAPASFSPIGLPIAARGSVEDVGPGDQL